MIRHFPILGLCRQSHYMSRCVPTLLKLPHHVRHQTRQARIKTINHRAIPFVYVSGAIGVTLFVLIIKREFDRIRQRLHGFEKLKIPEFGKRSVIHRHKDTVLFDVVAKSFKDVETFQVRPDDIWVVSFPRSGTTWLQEIVYLIETNLNFKAAKSQTLDERFPYLEFEYPGIKEIEKQDSPRYIKSHLPFQLLPPSFHEEKPKVVYIARNPRDVILSYFFYARMLQPLNFTGDFTQFADLFLKNLVPYAPWWNHVLQFWQHRHDDNVLFITYEQLHKNTRATVREVANFLGKKLSDDEVNAIVDHCSFAAMRDNDSVNHSWFDTLGLRRPGEEPFIRSGKIGEWQSYFSEKLNVRVEQMLQYRFKDTQLYFDFYPKQSSPAQLSSDSVHDCMTGITDV